MIQSQNSEIEIIVITGTRPRQNCRHCKLPSPPCVSIVSSSGDPACTIDPPVGLCRISHLFTSGDNAGIMIRHRTRAHSVLAAGSISTLPTCIVGLRNGQTLYWEHVRAHSQVLCLHCIFENLADRNNFLFE